MSCARPAAASGPLRALPTPPASLHPFPSSLCFESSVNVSILVVAIVLFLLVLHHNFLGLSDLLKRELTGVCAPRARGCAMMQLCSPNGALSLCLCPLLLPSALPSTTEPLHVPVDPRFPAFQLCSSRC